VSYVPTDVIEVLAWDRRVGAVAFDPATEVYAFEYDDDWVRSGRPLAPFHLPNRPGVFTFPELDRRTFFGLPPMVADALPDRFGNALVDRWMVEHGVPREEITALDRLAYAADRSMGALEFRPPVGREAEVTAIQLADLVTAARAAITGDLDGASTEALRELIQVGTSAGGARAKAVIAYKPETGQVRSGQFAAPEGYEHWLVKLDGAGGDPSREADALTEGAGFGKVEYAYHLMATAAGIEMMPCRLLPEGGRTHFLTRRFDRTDDGGKVHVQTLCALDHLDFNQAGAHGYAQYLDVIERLGLGPDRLEQGFRRVVFNIAAMNRDDHTKNLSFVLPRDGEWDLAPAYDVTHAHNPTGEWTSLHQMSVNGKRDDISVADLIELGDRWRVPGIREVVRDVTAAVDQWPLHAEEAGVDAGHRDRISTDLAAHRPR